MIINLKCRGCGRPIPEQRRRDSRFCTAKCRNTFRRAYFATPAGEIPPGEYLIALQGATTGNVLVSHSRAARTRIRTAQASCSESLTLLGVVPADEARAARFKRAHEAFLIRGSWYRAAPEVLAYFQRRSIVRAGRDPLTATDPVAAAEGAARLKDAASGGDQEQQAGQEHEAGRDDRAA